MDFGGFKFRFKCKFKRAGAVYEKTVARSPEIF
jgi:hypothetical protein